MKYMVALHYSNEHHGISNHQKIDRLFSDTAATLPNSVIFWLNYSILQWHSWIDQAQCVTWVAGYVMLPAVKIAWHRGNPPSGYGGSSRWRHQARGNRNSGMVRSMTLFAQLWILLMAAVAQCPARIELFAAAEQREKRNIHVLWEYPWR